MTRFFSNWLTFYDHAFFNAKYSRQKVDQKCLLPFKSFRENVSNKIVQKPLYSVSDDDK